MTKSDHSNWQEHIVSPEKVMEKIEPGMSIFLGTGVGEPRTLVKHLMSSDAANLTDLELIQLVSLGDAISLKALATNTYRLKTFFSEVDLFLRLVEENQQLEYIREQIDNFQILFKGFMGVRHVDFLAYKPPVDVQTC